MLVYVTRATSCPCTDDCPVKISVEYVFEYFLVADYEESARALAESAFLAGTHGWGDDPRRVVVGRGQRVVEIRRGERTH